MTTDISDGILPVRGLMKRDLRLTTLGFGGAPIGNLLAAVDDAAAAEAVATAWRLGIRYFDTAPHYGLGLSERRLGEALAGKPRNDYVLSTKVGRLLVPNARATGSDLDSGGFDVSDDTTRVFDYSRDGIRRSIESSLDRLGLEKIDIAYLHDPEDHMEQALTEGVAALAELRDEGVVRAIGAGMNFVEPLLRFARESDVDILMVAGRYTLIDRSATELLDECARLSISVVSAAPFNSGLLAKPWPDEDSQFDYETAGTEVMNRARALAQTCIEHGSELPSAALQFPLRHSAVVSVLAGMRSQEEVVLAVRRSQCPVPEGAWTAIG